MAVMLFHVEGNLECLVVNQTLYHHHIFLSSFYFVVLNLCIPDVRYCFSLR